MSCCKVIHLLMTTVLVTLCTFSCDLFDTEEKDTSTDNQVITPDTIERPVGWEYDSHDKDAIADYSTLFPDNKVNRIDIVIKDSSWKVLMDDMASMSGTFGSGSTRGGIPGNTGTKDTTGQVLPGTGDPLTGQIPQEFYDAAKDKKIGDSCSCTMMGTAISGKVDTTGGKLYCKPQMGDIGEKGDIGGMDNTEFLPREPVYIPVTFEFNGKKWTNVGFRLKGNSSLISAWGQGVYKLPFRIKTDKFEKEFPLIKNQRIYGFQNLSLCNNYMDNSMVHEKIASDLFQSNNIPASKSAFVRLYVDYGMGKKYFGLYTLAEVPDKPFLEKWFSNKTGNLYKPEGTGAKFATFDATSFKERNNDDNSLSDISNVFTALHSDRSNAGVWRSQLENVFNAQHFVKWLAINTAIGNWDCYGMMAHNYYLYNNNGVLTWIPWDLGLSFSESGGMGQMPGNSTSSNTTAALTHSNTSSNWPLIRFILDDSVYYALYLSEIKKFSANSFKSGSAVRKVQAVHDLIAPYVTGTEPEQSGYTFLTSPADFENSFTSLSQFITKQSVAIDTISESK